MASIVIFDVRPGPNFEGGDDIVYTCKCRCSGMAPTDDYIECMATVDPSALGTAINAAILDAAIATVADFGYTVGLLDKKTIIGGALGL